MTDFAKVRYSQLTVELTTELPGCYERVGRLLAELQALLQCPQLGQIFKSMNDAATQQVVGHVLALDQEVLRVLRLVKAGQRDQDFACLLSLKEAYTYLPTDMSALAPSTAERMVLQAAEEVDLATDLIVCSNV